MNVECSHTKISIDITASIVMATLGLTLQVFIQKFDSMIVQHNKLYRIKVLLDSFN